MFDLSDSWGEIANLGKSPSKIEFILAIIVISGIIIGGILVNVL